jgi:hypothetical protein
MLPATATKPAVRGALADATTANIVKNGSLGNRQTVPRATSDCREPNADNRGPGSRDYDPLQHRHSSRFDAEDLTPAESCAPAT